MTEAFRPKLSRLLALRPFAAPESTDLQRRVLRVERNIILPARLVVIAILYHSVEFSPWLGYVAYSLEVDVAVVTSLFWVYVGAVLVGGLLLMVGRVLPPTLARGTTLLLSFLDVLFLAGLTLITGGYDSILYWVFVMLVVRNTVVEPLSLIQLIMNVFTAGCYLLASLTDYVLAGSTVGHPADVLLVQTLLLLLVAACGFGVQLLHERQRRAEAEARDFSLRENQLRSMGRMAAEIAHQLKNPLAIINNTTFSLQRATKSAEPEVSNCTRIIREEIERADRILTQVMGYAHLSEGTIQRLDVSAELDSAVEEVFPQGAEFPVRIQRTYQANVPPLMMQRQHLRKILVNLLANARDACSKPGFVGLTVQSPDRRRVEIVIEDSGPGIAQDQLKRIFEAYYTTKAKGTGLGLAIVKNNTELYGGAVRVESELGKGARFSLIFPATGFAPSRV